MGLLKGFREKRAEKKFGQLAEFHRMVSEACGPLKHEPEGEELDALRIAPATQAARGGPSGSILITIVEERYKKHPTVQIEGRLRAGSRLLSKFSWKTDAPTFMKSADLAPALFHKDIMALAGVKTRKERNKEIWKYVSEELVARSLGVRLRR